MLFQRLPASFAISDFRPGMIRTEDRDSEVDCLLFSITIYESKVSFWLHRSD